MNIETVAANLRNTIAGKEAYMQTVLQVRCIDVEDRIHCAAIVGMLELNLIELKAILTDVESCSPSVAT